VHRRDAGVRSRHQAWWRDDEDTQWPVGRSSEEHDQSGARFAHTHRSATSVGSLRLPRSVSPIVIRLGRLGDTIMLSPLLQSLHARYGQPCRLISASPWSQQLYGSDPHVKGIYSFDRHSPFMLGIDWWRAFFMLRRSPLAPVYVCEPELLQLARISRLLALSGVDHSRRLFITDFPEIANIHWSDRLEHFGRETPAALRPAFGRTVTLSEHIPTLRIADADRFDRDAWLSKRNWRDRTLLLIQPGNHLTLRNRGRRRNVSDSKAWPIKRWAALLQRVRAQMPHALIMICGAPEETFLLEEIRAATQISDLVIATPSLRRLFALCELADAMISVDSGPAHAAAALSLPVLILFGEHPQQRWLPRAHTCGAVVGVGGPPASTRAEQISVDTAFAAWCSLRAQVARARGGERARAASQH